LPAARLAEQLNAVQIDGTAQIKLHGIAHDFMNLHDPSRRLALKTP
jgi:hypothetical protein